MAASLFCGLFVLLCDVQKLISLGVRDSSFSDDMCQSDTSSLYHLMQCKSYETNEAINYFFISLYVLPVVLVMLFLKCAKSVLFQVKPLLKR